VSRRSSAARIGAQTTTASARYMRRDLADPHWHARPAPHSHPSPTPHSHPSPALARLADIGPAPDAGPAPHSHPSPGPAPAPQPRTALARLADAGPALDAGLDRLTCPDRRPGHCGLLDRCLSGAVRSRVRTRPTRHRSRTHPAREPTPRAALHTSHQPLATRHKCRNPGTAHLARMSRCHITTARTRPRRHRSWSLGSPGRDCGATSCPRRSSAVQDPWGTGPDPSDGSGTMGRVQAVSRRSSAARTGFVVPEACQ
jgi:hypothetical protein